MFKLDVIKKILRNIEKKYRRIVFTPEQAISLEAEACSRDQNR